MYNRGYTGTGEIEKQQYGSPSSIIKTPNSKKRPHTGSINGRITGGYKT
jgi:hypothetical protein